MMEKKNNDKGKLINQTAWFTRLYIYIYIWLKLCCHLVPILKINRHKTLFGFFLKNRFCWVDTLDRRNEAAGKSVQRMLCVKKFDL